jgi:hypothetical protein
VNLVVVSEVPYLLVSSHTGEAAVFGASLPTLGSDVLNLFLRAVKRVSRGFAQQISSVTYRLVKFPGFVLSVMRKNTNAKRSRICNDALVICGIRLLYIYWPAKRGCLVIICGTKYCQYVSCTSRQSTESHVNHKCGDDERDDLCCLTYDN